jgi:hypothetical protein
VTDGEERTASENAKHPGSPVIRWEFTIDSDKHPEYPNRKQFATQSLLPQALFGLKELLLATDKYSEEDLSGDLDFDIQDVVGAEVLLKLNVTKYDGEDVNNIKRFRSISDGIPGGDEVDALRP